MHRPWVRPVLAFAVLAVVAVVAASGCSGSPTTAPPAPDPDGPATVASGGRDRLDGFREITVTVVDDQGRTRTYCLLLADTPELREQGLMHVTDPALGGYDGMMFFYEEDDDSGFWMRNTRLPLSIAWVRGRRHRRCRRPTWSPAPTTPPTCPTYPPAGSYRYAVEVPQGRLDDIGISDRARGEPRASRRLPRRVPEQPFLSHPPGMMVPMRVCPAAVH